MLTSTILIPASAKIPQMQNFAQKLTDQEVVLGATHPHGATFFSDTHMVEVSFLFDAWDFVNRDVTCSTRANKYAALVGEPALARRSAFGDMVASIWVREKPEPVDVTHLASQLRQVAAGIETWGAIVPTWDPFGDFFSRLRFLRSPSAESQLTLLAAAMHEHAKYVPSDLWLQHSALSGDPLASMFTAANPRIKFDSAVDGPFEWEIAGALLAQRAGWITNNQYQEFRTAYLGNDIVVDDDALQWCLGARVLIAALKTTELAEQDETWLLETDVRLGEFFDKQSPIWRPTHGFAR